MIVRAVIGLGANLGDPRNAIRAAVRSLEGLGRVAAVSRLYRSKPWGVSEQPDFYNAAAIVETQAAPRELLSGLKRIERELGREPGPRWGPRAIDLDILLYGDLTIDEPDLQIPHPRLFERAFALVPLAELDPRFAPAVQNLDPSERAGVFPLEGGESVALMSDEALIERVRTLTCAFIETDLVRLRIEDADESSVELRKPATAPLRRAAVPASNGQAQAPVEALEPIKADLVGIFHFSRPPVFEGDRLEGDRELGYVEALGIRNPVRSLGAGRVAAVNCEDGQTVEYGQILFELARV